MSLRALSLSVALAGCLSAPRAASAPGGQAPLRSDGRTGERDETVQADSPAQQPARAVPSRPEIHERRPFGMLDNGAFDEPLPKFKDPGGTRRIPWWRSGGGAQQVVELEGRPCLRTGPGEWASQPVAAFAPALDGLVVRGQVRGAGRLRLRDGGGRVLQAEWNTERFEPFEFTLAELAGRAEPPLDVGELRPRLELELGASAERGAHWRALEVQVLLPCPDPADLRRELVAELDWIFGLWLERGIDDLGSRHTGFLGRRFDILTGEPKATVPGGHNVFFDLLMRAAAVEPASAWSAAFERFLSDFFELGFDPTTGLPRHWDVERDEPLASYLEIAEVLRFLLDLAEDGPEAYRERALARARTLGQTVLAHGVLPDGRVAAKYRPTDAQPNSDTSFLRQLDLPAELGRLGARIGDGTYRDVALQALGVLEYAHVWPGVWHSIDPGFDDQYGHYGARAVVLWRAWPDERSFRRLAYAGLGHYVPLWRDALRLGGNVAADQVRCWGIALDVIDLDPSARKPLAPVLAAAGRAHFKGEQYGNGAWGDVTHFGFDPQPHLQVGDLTGVPQNLLEGLALLHDAPLAEAGGMPLDEVRARFYAVWASSREHYRRPFGYMASREESAGDNLSFGSLRLAVGLVTLLERLP